MLYCLILSKVSFSFCALVLLTVRHVAKEIPPATMKPTPKSKFGFLGGIFNGLIADLLNFLTAFRLIRLCHANANPLRAPMTIASKKHGSSTKRTCRGGIEVVCIKNVPWRPAGHFCFYPWRSCLQPFRLRNQRCDGVCTRLSLVAATKRNSRIGAAPSKRTMKIDLDNHHHYHHRRAT